MYVNRGYAYPRVPVSGGFRRAGMGDVLPTTPCPSLEQMLGITDAADPCQAPVGSSMGQTCYNTATGSYVACPIGGVQQTTPPGSTGPLGAPASTAGLTSWFSQNSSLVLGGLGALLLLAFLGGGGRR